MRRPRTPPPTFCSSRGVLRLLLLSRNLNQEARSLFPQSFPRLGENAGFAANYVTITYSCMGCQSKKVDPLPTKQLLTIKQENRTTIYKPSPPEWHVGPQKITPSSHSSDCRVESWPRLFKGWMALSTG